MQTNHQSNLDSAIDAVRLRFGSQSLLNGDRLPAPEPWPTGIEALDRMSGIGGLPRGRLGVLSGAHTCGKLSLGLALLARATRDLAQAAVIDPSRTFDAWALEAHGPDLGRLAVVRPPTGAATGEAAAALARAGVGMLLLLLPARLAAGSDAWLHSLEAAAARSGTLALAVVESCPRPLAHASSLSLACEREGWLFERGLLTGIRTRVACTKNRVGVPGGAAELEIRYPIGTRASVGRPVLAVPALLPAVEVAGCESSAV